MDDDNYPTDEELDQLEAFEGTPAGFVEAVRQLWDYPDAVRVEDATDRLGRPVKRVSMVTLGWSGNESVVSVVGRTMFHALWWESSHRGGLTVYQVPAEQWDTHWELASIMPDPVLGWVILQQHPDRDAPSVIGPRKLFLDPAQAADEVAALNKGAALGVACRLGAVHAA